MTHQPEDLVQRPGPSPLKFGCLSLTPERGRTELGRPPARKRCTCRDPSQRSRRWRIQGCLRAVGVALVSSPRNPLTVRHTDCWPADSAIKVMKAFDEKVRVDNVMHF